MAALSYGGPSPPVPVIADTYSGRTNWSHCLLA